MASNNFGAGGTDAILRQLDTEAASTSIEVTLYLPWGMATGITVPGTYFGHYVAHFFTKHDAGDIAGRLAVLEAEQDRVFIHLRKARCYVAGQLVTHDSLRVRLSDVSAWTVAGWRSDSRPRLPFPSHGLEGRGLVAVTVGDSASMVGADTAVARAIGPLVGFLKSREARTEAERQAMRAVEAAERAAAAEQRIADASERHATAHTAQGTTTCHRTRRSRGTFAVANVPIPERSNCRLHNMTALPKYNVDVIRLSVGPREMRYPQIPGHGWVEIEVRAGWDENEVEVSWNRSLDETNERLTWRGQLSQLSR